MTSNGRSTGKKASEVAMKSTSDDEIAAALAQVTQQRKEH